MAVIAKMSVNASRLFADASIMLSLGCVYDTGLAGGENEDVRFTKASPSGAGQVTVGKHIVLSDDKPTFYLLFHPHADDINFDNCDFALIARCAVIEEYGHSRKAKWGHWSSSDPRLPEAKRAAERPEFTLDMTIDNPAASIQFEAGRSYWVSFYDASRVSMDEAIALARA